jgi:hypothetical protein
MLGSFTTFFPAPPAEIRRRPNDGIQNYRQWFFSGKEGDLPSKIP